MKAVKTEEIITQINSKKDLKKALSNMIKSRIQKDVDKILDGGEVKFISGGIKRTIKEMPEELKEDLMEFYRNTFEVILIGMQKGETFKRESALSEKDSETINKLNLYLESRFE